MLLKEGECSCLGHEGKSVWLIGGGHRDGQSAEEMKGQGGKGLTSGY